MSRSRRTAWTFATSLLTSGSGMVLGFVTTPLLLRWLGDERVGAFRTAVEWVGYLALLDFGLAGALQVAIGRSVAAGDQAGAAAAVWAGVRASLLLAVAGVVAVVALAAVAPLLIRGLDPGVARELQFGLLVSLAGLVWLPLAAFRPLAEAGQRGYVVQLAAIAQGWLTAGLSVGLAAAGYGLPGQFLAVALGTGVAALILAGDGVRHHPQVLTRPRGGAQLPAVFSWRVMLFNLGGRLSQMSDCIILGLVLGPAVVVAYVVTQRLLLLAATQVQAVGASSWAGLLELHVQGQAELLNHRLIQLTRLTSALGLGLVVPTAVFTPTLVGLWVGPERYGGHLLTAATAGYVWAFGLVSLWGWPILAIGRYDLALRAMAVGVPVNLGVSVAGAIWLGPAGPAIGSAISFGLVYSWMNPLFLRQLYGTPMRGLSVAALGPLTLAIPYTAALVVAVANAPPLPPDVPVASRWVVVATGIAAAGGGYLALAWFLVLPPSDRRELLDRVRR